MFNTLQHMRRRCCTATRLCSTHSNTCDGDAALTLDYVQHTPTHATEMLHCHSTMFNTLQHIRRRCCTATRLCSTHFNTCDGDAALPLDYVQHTSTHATEMLHCHSTMFNTLQHMRQRCCTDTRLCSTHFNTCDGDASLPLDYVQHTPTHATEMLHCLSTMFNTLQHMRRRCFTATRLCSTHFNTCDGDATLPLDYVQHTSTHATEMLHCHLSGMIAGSVHP